MNDMNLVNAVSAVPKKSEDSVTVAFNPSSVAQMFLNTGEKSGALADVLRSNYTREKLSLVVEALIRITGATSSNDARIKGFGTSVSRAVPFELNEEGKKVPLCKRLTVRWKQEKNPLSRDKAGKKNLKGYVEEKKEAKQKDSILLAAAALCDAVAFSFDADYEEGMHHLANAVTLMVERLSTQAQRTDQENKTLSKLRGTHDALNEAGY